MMDEERRTIIINEIKYWKKNQLLPEHYCNFLLMLYTEGEEIPEEEQKKKQFSNVIVLLIGFLALFSTFLIIYFTSFPLPLQIIVFLGIVCVVISAMLYVRARDLIIFHILLSILLLISLMASIHIVYFLLESSSAVIGTIAIHCMIWFIAGFYYQLVYLKWAGPIGFLFAVFFYWFS